MTKQTTILSTKKLLPNQKQLLLDANILVIEENFIETNSKNFELSNVNENLIFTSQNAVESVLDHPNVQIYKEKMYFVLESKPKNF